MALRDDLPCRRTYATQSSAAYRTGSSAARGAWSMTIGPVAGDRLQPDPLNLIRLTPLMLLTEGELWLRIGLIDGAIDLGHPHLSRTGIRVLGPVSVRATNAESEAVRHATFVAGVLHGQRGGSSPAIAPGCQLLVWPIFTSHDMRSPSAAPGALADALIGLVAAGARVVNISAVLMDSAAMSNRRVEAA